uniref:Uncharacterized protein n=1 Tax=Rhizophora mucronata TaxID=61149 RepID=A0A2P2N7K5_RHIMU
MSSLCNWCTGSFCFCARSIMIVKFLLDVPSGYWVGEGF